MRHFRILKLAVLLALLTACSTPQEDLLEAQKHSYEAQEEVARERLELVEKYQDCVDDADEGSGSAGPGPCDPVTPILLLGTGSPLTGGGSGAPLPPSTPSTCPLCSIRNSKLTDLRPTRRCSVLDSDRRFRQHLPGCPPKRMLERGVDVQCSFPRDSALTK